MTTLSETNMRANTRFAPTAETNTRANTRFAPATAPQTLPRISVVTATLNRAQYLEETIRSVLDQNYPNLEYIVIDGGSTDGSIDILRRYEDRLAHWVSEPDAGHFDALQKGFAQTTGDVMAFINSDDKFCPWAFSVVAEIFEKFPQVEWLTTRFPILWDAQGRATHCRATDGFSKEGFFRGQYLPGNNGAYATHWIQQESTFWRRSLWEKAGGFVERGQVAGDFELWARFFQHAELYAVSTPLGGFRIHGDQITANQLAKYRAACVEILRKHGGRPHGPLMSKLAKGRMGKYLPNSVKRALGLEYPTKTIAHQGGGIGWTIRQA